MRILGELIVILGVAPVVIVVMRRVVTPALRRRHIEQLERENERLDRLLQRNRDDQPLPRKITLAWLRRKLSSYDIRVVDVFVNNVGYSQAYTDAIEQKQARVQAALQAQAKAAEAQAEAQQAVAKARGEAEAISLRGKALHNNPELLRLEAIDKLNPQAEVVICTGQTCPAFLASLIGSGK
jgi:regulator of protease activity HflC (stomatin/prohibitin superfamily)